MADYNEAFKRMAVYGGDFAKSLSYCWMKADPGNRQRLEQAFPEMIDKYEHMFDNASKPQDVSLSNAEG